ncbi:hypothetical protein AGMMS50276_03060 [Synergistales bacterium]|nr:hypothetical protein AGMMS50276_03060 [Synergistales bacterium]
MIALKCKMCGGDIQANADQNYGTCDSCGGVMTLPNASDERRANLFNRANHFRMSGDFDKAVTAYEGILNEDNKDAEAHWGVALCRYGIEYVEDPVTHKMTPTCHRAQYESILTDPDYLAAVEYAPDGYSRSLYEEEAKTISEIQKGILAVSKNEAPFDVFICYKEATDGGSRTKDSVVAQKIYDKLTQSGYTVFFARITLEDKIGSAYEPYIFSALNSARVMLVIGTSPEYFKAVWVKNEWSRYLTLMKKDPGRLLIPCYNGFEPYDLPEELSFLQAQDMGKVGFMQDLMRGIDKVLKEQPKTAAAPVVVSGAAQTQSAAEPLVKRAFIMLEDGEWAKADELLEQALNTDPENARAYIGKLMAELKVSSEAELGEQAKSIADNKNFQKALRFADAQQAEIYNGYEQTILARKREFEEKYREKIKHYAETISTGYCHTVGLKSDGTVVAVGDNKHGSCNVNAWHDIIAISAGHSHTVGLKSDGTVVAVGDNEHGSCNVNAWRDIIAVSAGSCHTVGLKSDGTVVAVGINDKSKFAHLFEHGQCNVNAWRDVIAISTGYCHTVGLKSDGTVVAVGDNSCGQCNVNAWRDVIAISTGYCHTVGLKSDGTVVAVGINDKSEFAHLFEHGQCNVNAWHDIIAISAGHSHTVGLKSDGTVVAVGYNINGQYNVSNWRDVIAISAGHSHTVGLKSDGTVIAVGWNGYGQCNVSNWRDVMIYTDPARLEAIKHGAERRRIEAEERKKRKKSELNAELVKLNKEYAGLGLLSVFRKSEIKQRTEEIWRELSRL